MLVVVEDMTSRFVYHNEGHYRIHMTWCKIVISTYIAMWSDVLAAYLHQLTHAWPSKTSRIIEQLVNTLRWLQTLVIAAPPASSD